MAEATAEVERATSELGDGITGHFGHRTAEDIKYIKGQLDTESSADQYKQNCLQKNYGSDSS